MIRRYEHPAPGDMIHVEVKKLGPDGGGHRMLGRAAGRRHRGEGSRGYHFLHTVVDDHSRVAYAEILTDERKDTAAEFWVRAVTWFTAAGATPT